MGSHHSRSSRIALWVIILAAAAALIAGALLFFSKLERKTDPEPTNAGQAPTLRNTPEPGQVDDGQELPVIVYDGKQYVYNDRLSALLILGIDDPELEDYHSSRNTGQADFLMLAVFDPDAESCTLIQLDRDTMCQVPVLDFFGKQVYTTYEQLALAHTYGSGMERSCENTVTAVSDLLYGVTIHNYFALTMDAIPVLNDLVGGVTVTIEDDFSNVDRSLVKGETVTLMGDQVEHYVRARMSMGNDPTNRARMRRQRTYMTELFTLLGAAVKKDASFVLDAYGAVSGSLVTDCSVEGLNEYSRRFSDYELTGIVTPEGESKKGEEYMEFIVDEEALQELVIGTFYRPVD